MNNTEILMAVVAASLVLLINWRALKSHNLPAGKLAKLAGIWVVIIVALALAARFFIG